MKKPAPLIFVFAVVLTPLLLWPLSQVVLVGIRVVMPASAPPMSAAWMIVAIGVTTIVSVVLAVLAASMLVGLAMRLDDGQESQRPDSQDECRGCGYSLEGLTHDRCPECGEDLSSS